MRLSNRKINKLVLPNLQLVPRLAQRYRGKGRELSELRAVGNLVLMEAALTYRPGCRTNFREYATREIRKTLVYGVREARAQADLSVPGRSEVGPEQYAIDRERLMMRFAGREPRFKQPLPSASETAKFVAVYGRPGPQRISGLSEEIKDIIMYLARKLKPHLSHEEIGAPFRLQRSAVVVGIESVAGRCAKDAGFKAYIQGLLQACGNLERVEQISTKD